MRFRVAVDRLGFGRARLGELASDAADLHDGRTAREGEHDGHLQEHPEEIADVVGGMLREALGAIAALEQERLAGRDLRERPLQLARLTCKNERRKPGELLLDGLQRRRIGIAGHLLDGHLPPALRRPPLAHDTLPVWPKPRDAAVRSGSYTRGGGEKASAANGEWEGGWTAH